MERKHEQESWATLLLPVALIVGLVLLLRLDPGATGTEPSEVSLLEHWLRIIVGYLAGVAEIAAASVIGIAVLRGLWSFVRLTFSPDAQRIEQSEELRLA